MNISATETWFIINKTEIVASVSVHYSSKFTNFVLEAGETPFIHTTSQFVIAASLDAKKSICTKPKP
jgi:hypothetical protein